MLHPWFDHVKGATAGRVTARDLATVDGAGAAQGSTSCGAR